MKDSFQTRSYFMEDKVRMKNSFFLYFLSVSLLIGCDNKGGSGGDSASAFALLQLLQNGTGTYSFCRNYSPAESNSVFVANQVILAPAHTGNGFRDSYCAANGIRGIDKFNGSLDVFTLDTSGPGATLILGWSGKKVLPVSGIDFIAYENPFFIGAQNNTNPFNQVFLEPMVVEVGNDRSNWCGWNPVYTNGNPNSFSEDPSVWSRFGGITPFVYNQETNPMTVASIYNTDVVHGGGGGDGFDLADANFGASGSGCSGSLKTDLQTNGFTYIKLTSAIVLMPSLPIPVGNGSPDIDGVIAKSISP